MKQWLRRAGVISRPSVESIVGGIFIGLGIGFGLTAATLEANPSGMFPSSEMLQFWTIPAVAFLILAVILISHSYSKASKQS